MIKDNKDLKHMEDLMGVTRTFKNTHMAAYDDIKDRILNINEEAEAAIESLNFYNHDHLDKINEEDEDDD